MSLVDTLVIFIYFAAMLAFAAVVRRGRGFSDFSVAERSVPASVVFATLAATFIGPGYSLGLTGKGGATGFFFLLPFCMFSLQTVLVGTFLAPRLHAMRDCHTLGDVMGSFYGEIGKVLTGVISVGLCLGFFAVMAKAGGVVVAGGLGVSVEAGVVLVTVVGALYALTGGLRAVIATDAVQFGILLAVFAIIGISTAVRVESFAELQIGAVEATKTAFDSTPIGDIVALCASFFLGEALIPPYANRALAAESGSTSRRAFIGAGLFSVLWFLMVVSIGFAGRAVLPSGGATEGDELLVAIAEHVLPNGMWGLFVVGLAAVVMSSQESVLNAGAVAAVRDLALPLRKQLTEGSQLRLARIATAVIALVGLFAAIQAPSIIKGLLICYGIWAPSVLPALVWGLVGLPTNRYAGVGAVVTGAGGSVGALLVFGSESVVMPLACGFGGAAVGALVGLAVSNILDGGTR